MVIYDGVDIDHSSAPAAALHSSWVADELKVVRNTHAAFHLPGGTIAGMAHSGLSCLITQGKEPWTLRNKVKDADRTRPAKECEEIVYPKPDGVLSFDLLTNLQRSGTGCQLGKVMVLSNLSYLLCNLPTSVQAHLTITTSLPT